MLVEIVIDNYGTVRFFDENGDWHRIDGPAIEYSDGTKSWFIHNKRYLEKEFNEIVGKLC